MILEFSVENFRSFKSRQTASFVAGTDRNHPSNVTKFPEAKILKTIGVWGPNASGKSNLVYGLVAMRALAVHSSTGWNRGDQIPFVAPFLLDALDANKPSTFSITVRLDDGEIFEYTLSATTAQVTFESLIVDRPHQPKAELFHRRREPDGSMVWRFARSLEPVEQQLRTQTRDNASVLSHGSQLNVRAFAPLYDWFKNLIAIVPAEAQLNRANFAAWVSADPRRQKRVAALLHDADIGIGDLEIRQKSIELPKLARGMIDALREHMPVPVSAGSAAMTTQRIITKHRAASPLEWVEFDLESQDSNGTQQLFTLGSAFLMALEQGAQLVIDEIDCSMHPILAAGLLELFQNERANVRNAQLLFTTHDVTLMNQHLLRRDQIWLVDKSLDGSSSLCSLFDFEDPEQKPRSTERFARNYMAGRYGAVPHLGAIFEDFDPQWLQKGADIGNETRND